MKKILYLLVLFALSACHEENIFTTSIPKTPNTNIPTIIINSKPVDYKTKRAEDFFVDFNKYQKDSFYFGGDCYNGKCATLGLVHIIWIPNVVNKPIPNYYYYVIYSLDNFKTDTTIFLIQNITAQNVADSICRLAKKLGADGISNFKINTLVENYRVSAFNYQDPRTFPYYGYEASGIAIKREK